MDTIFALSSGQPPAAIAIIRVSGPAAAMVAEHIAGHMPPPRRARMATLRDPFRGEILDRALILWLPGPASATGEDLLELHVHGSRAVVAATLATLRRIEGCRDAEPGEFTRRALQRGRIDLIEAEGLADLLSAETEAQRKQALRAAEGGVSRLVEQWRQRVLGHAAIVEALIDFGEEDDVAADPARLQASIAADAAALKQALESPTTERLRDGIRVVLAGPPNAGKSTLLNALCGRDAAIVSSMPGTTRDRIEVPLAIDGIPFLLIDTAGLRDDWDDAVEGIGIDRTQQALAEADLVLWLGDGAAPNMAGDHIIVIEAKADIVATKRRGIRVSARTGDGLTELIDAILVRARRLVPADNAIAFNARQRTHLAVVRSALSDAQGQDDLVLIAEALRAALSALDALTGKAGVEDMLDGLFGRFCLGK